MVRRSLGIRLAAFAALGVAVAAILSVSAPPSAAATPNLAPALGSLYGAHVSGGQAGISSFESSLGRKLAVDNHFWAWTDSWPTSSFEGWDVQNGRIPMVSWDGPNTTLANISNGSQDAIIRNRANAAAAFGQPILVRWGYEMNGDWFAWSGAKNGNNPAAFVSAWKHIVNIFRSAGATNALWVWAVNNGDKPNLSWNRYWNYYPGDDYVDWVGIDGYNWGTTYSWSSWQSLTQVFSIGSPSPYQTYAGRKPIMIAETGSVEAGGNKANWYSSIPGELQNTLPGIKAVVFFEDIHNGIDVRSQSSSTAFAGYKQMALSSWFNPGSSSSSSSSSTCSGYGQSVLADSPQGYWHFSETSGTTAADASSASADGSYSSPGLGQAGAFAGSASVLFLGGSSAKASFGDRYDFSGTAPFTLEAWVKPAALDTYYRRLFSKETTDSRGHEGYLIWLRSNGVGFERWAGNYRTLISTTALPVGSWSLIDASFDGSVMRLSVNGRQVASGSSTLSIPALSVPFTIASVSGGGNYLSATIDEPAVYGKALGSTRISAHYQAACR